MNPKQFRQAIARQSTGKPILDALFNASESFAEDHGGNFIEDRREANLDQWDDERPFDGEDVENWQRRSEEQGAE